MYNFAIEKIEQQLTIIDDITLEINELIKTSDRTNYDQLKQIRKKVNEMYFLNGECYQILKQLDDSKQQTEYDESDRYYESSKINE